MPNTSSDYFLRVKASDRAEMRRVLKAINVLDANPDGPGVIPHHAGDSWVEVGLLPDWRVPPVLGPDGSVVTPSPPLKDPVSGENYWHYNLRTSINVRKRIKDLVAAGDADAILLDANKGRWFSKVTSDEDDTPTQPRSVWL